MRMPKIMSIFFMIHVKLSLLFERASQEWVEGLKRNEE